VVVVVVVVVAAAAVVMVSCVYCGVQLESKVIAKWNVLDLVFYLGVQQRRNPASRYR